MRTGGGASRVLLLLAALLFSTGGAAIKLATLSGWQIASYRAGVAALFLWLVLPGARRGWTWRTLAGGSVYAATVILFVLSNKLTTAANAILLQSTYPLYLLLLGPFFLKEKLRAVDLGVITGVAVGVLVLVSGTEQVVATAPDPARGNLVALASGVTWALTIAVLRWMGKRDGHAESAAAVAIAGNMIAFAVCLPLAMSGPALNKESAAVIAWLGLFQVGLAYVFLTRSIRHIPAMEAATLLMIEPVLNPIWAWIVHGEHPSGLAMAGGGIIMTTAVAGSWVQAAVMSSSAEEPEEVESFPPPP